MGELFAVFGVDWKLLLVQAFNFGLLLAVLTYFLYTPVLRIIDERRKKIAEGVQNAEEAEKNLATSETKGKEIMNKASREAETILTAARARAEEKGSELMRETETRAGALLAEAEARAAEAERQALLKSQKEIARAAMLAAEKILRTSK